MIIQSTRFGQLEAEPSDLWQFAEGLPGFPEEKTFAFFAYKPDSPFYFLQSASEPDLTFLLINPFDFFKDYEFALEDDKVEQLGLTAENAPEVYAIVSIREKLEDMSANLLAPIIVNRKSGQAMQLILDKGAYTTRHPLVFEVQKTSSEGGE